MIQPPKAFPVWVTADKRKIAVTKMDARHILNTIRYLERRVRELTDPEKIEIRTRWITVFAQELVKRHKEGREDLDTLPARTNEYNESAPHEVFQ